MSQIENDNEQFQNFMSVQSDSALSKEIEQACDAQTKHGAEPSTLKNTAKKTFFKAYASHLRVETRIEGVFDRKADLKLPDVLQHRQFLSPHRAPSNQDQPIMGRDVSASSIGLTKSKKSRYCESNGKASQKALQEFIREQSRNKKSLTLQTNDISDIIKSQRNLLLANSPQEQYQRSINASAKNSPTRSLRSIFNSSNLKINRNSARIDNPFYQKTIVENQIKTAISSNSIANLVQAKNFIAPSENNKHANSFNQRSFSLQPAPVQVGTTWHSKLSENDFNSRQSRLPDQSAISLRIQEATHSNNLSLLSPSQMSINENAENFKQKRFSLQPDQSHLKIGLDEPILDQNNFFTKKNSKAALRILRKGSGSEQLAVSPSYRGLSVPSTPAKQFGMNAELQDIVPTGICKEPSEIFGLTNYQSVLAFKQQDQYERTTKMQANKQINANERKELSKMRSISMFSKLTLAERQERVLKIQSEQKAIQNMELPQPKRGLKVFGLTPAKPYVQEVAKAKAESSKEENQVPIHEELEVKEAMRVLDKSESIGGSQDMSLNLVKAYKKRLGEANDHMINVIYKQSKELQNTIKVLDFQQEQQRNPNSKHAEKDYFQIKEIMLKKEAAEKQKLLEEEERRRMDEIYRKTGGATTAITNTSFRQSEMVSGTHTHRDDKTETNLQTRTEANTAMDLIHQARADQQSMGQSIKSRPHYQDTEFNNEELPVLKQQLKIQKDISQPLDEKLGRILDQNNKSFAYKSPSDKQDPLEIQKFANATGVNLKVNEKGGNTFINSNILNMQRTQNSLNTERKPQDLLDANVGNAFTLRGDVNLFDASNNPVRRQTDIPQNINVQSIFDAPLKSEINEAIEKQEPSHEQKEQEKSNTRLEQASAIESQQPKSQKSQRAQQENTLGQELIATEDDDEKKKYSDIKSEFLPKITIASLEQKTVSSIKEDELQGKSKQESEEFRKQESTQQLVSNFGPRFAPIDIALADEEKSDSNSKKSANIRATIGIAMPVPVSESDRHTPDLVREQSAKQRKRNLSQFVKFSKQDKKKYVKNQDSDTDSLVTSIEVSSEKSASCGTLGVHDFIYSEKHWGKSKIPRVGAAEKLTADPAASLIPEHEKCRGSYNHEDHYFQSFLRLCQTTVDSQNVINPYPILHQLYQGILFIKAQKYDHNVWPVLIEKAINLSLAQPQSLYVKIFYLESCWIDDQTLSKVINMISRASSLQEIYLVSMNIGPLTIESLTKLSETQRSMGNSVGINIRKSPLLANDFHKSCPFILNWDYPLIHHELSGLTQLTLSGQRLYDSHIDLIQQRVPQLELLDISFNEFSAEGLTALMQAMLRFSRSEIKLRSLSLAGNDLGKPNSSLILTDTFKELFEKPFLQHIDLSLTSIDKSPQVVKRVMNALKQARSLQSIHFSSSDISRLNQNALDVFGSLLQSRMTMKSKISSGVSSAWNEKYQLPHRRNNNISEDVCADLNSQAQKTEYVKNQQLKQEQDQQKEQETKIKDYHEQRMVLSRIIGRNDIRNNLSWMKKDDKGRLRDIREELSEETQIEVMRGQKTIDSVCWVKSQECWICERWSYYLAMVSKTEIDDCFNLVDTSKLQSLNEVQERAFSKLCEQAEKKLGDLDFRVPYLIGELTNFQFLRMTEFTDYMLSIDPDAEKIKWNTQNKQTKLFHHYAGSNRWEKVVHRAQQPDVNSQDFMNRSTKTKTAQHRGGPAEPCQGKIFPYKVLCDRQKGMRFEDYENVWCLSTLIKPGISNFFLVYRYEPGIQLKACITTSKPLRETSLVHHHVLPKSKSKQTQEEKEAKQDANSYFNIFKSYQNVETEEYLRECLKQDFDLWEVQKIPELAKTEVMVYNRVTDEILKNCVAFMIVYRALLSNSETYPNLGWKETAEWIKEIAFTSQDYPMTKFETDFSLTKAIEKKALPRKISNRNLRIASKSKIMQSIGLKKKEETLPQNQLSRFLFLELIVRISISKFGERERNLDPAICVQRFVQEHLQPYFATKVGKQIQTPKVFLKNDLLPNRGVQKFLFLNQFGLKQIFDRLCDELEEKANAAGKDKAEGDRFKRRHTIRIPRKSSSRLDLKLLNLRRQSSLGSDGKQKEEDNTGRVSGLVSPKLSPTPVDDMSPQQRGSAMKSDSENNSNASKASKNKQRNKEGALENFGEKSSELKQVNIVTASGQNFTSALARGGLKKKMQSNSPKLKKQLTIKEEFLPKRKKVTKVTFEIVHKAIKESLSGDMARIFSMKVFRTCLANAKLTQMYTGNKPKRQEEDKNVGSQVSFIEFILLLCLLGFELEKQKGKERGLQVEKTTQEVVEEFITSFMYHNGVEVQQVPLPGQDLRGLAIPEDILLGDKVQPVRPPTPESEAESFYPDMYSEQD